MKVNGKGTKTTAVGLAAALILSGCATQEGTGQILGSILLGGLCMAIVKPRDRAACVAAAAAGFVIGGEIGRRMDERDRERRRQAVLSTLTNDDLWWSRHANEPESPRVVNGKPTNQTPPQNPAARTSSNGWVNPDAQVEWINPDTANSERIEPLRDYTSNGNGVQCRQFRETYFKQGDRPLTETHVFCKNANGAWTEQTSS